MVEEIEGGYVEIIERSRLMSVHLISSHLYQATMSS